MRGENSRERIRQNALTAIRGVGGVDVLTTATHHRARSFGKALVTNPSTHNGEGRRIAALSRFTLSVLTSTAMRWIKASMLNSWESRENGRWTVTGHHRAWTWTCDAGRPHLRQSAIIDARQPDRPGAGFINSRTKELSCKHCVCGQNLLCETLDGERKLLLCASETRSDLKAPRCRSFGRPRFLPSTYCSA